MLLIENGANINAVNNDNSSALMLALVEGCSDSKVVQNIRRNFN